MRGYTLSILLAILVAIPVQAAGAPDASADYATTSGPCDAIAATTDHCASTQTGTASITCDGDLCAIALAGASEGESKLPGATTLAASFDDATGQEPLHVILCRESSTTGGALSCAYDVTVSYVLPAGACATFHHYTTLSQGVAAFTAHAAESVTFCRDATGAASVTATAQTRAGEADLAFSEFLP